MKKRASGATGQMATVQDTEEDDLEVEEEEAIGNRSDLINMCVTLCKNGFSFFSLCQLVHFRS